MGGMPIWALPLAAAAYAPKYAGEIGQVMNLFDERKSRDVLAEQMNALNTAPDPSGTGVVSYDNLTAEHQKELLAAQKARLEQFRKEQARIGQNNVFSGYGQYAQETSAAGGTPSLADFATKNPGVFANTDPSAVKTGLEMFKIDNTGLDNGMRFDGNGVVRPVPGYIDATQQIGLSKIPVKIAESRAMRPEKVADATALIAPELQKQSLLIPIEAQKAAAVAKAKDAANPLMAGAVSSGGASGADYLATLPPTTAAQVKALAEGRMQFPAGFALKSPYWQQMISAVSQYDPNFDAVNYNARSKTRADFTSGKSAMNIKALNTAIGHLGTLDSQIGGTASHEIPLIGQGINYLENKAAQYGGDPGITKYNQTASALASELTQVFRGSGGNEADIKRYIDDLNPNASAAQKKAAVKNIVELLHSRTQAIGDQYNQGMGTTADPLTLLNPKAAEVVKRIKGIEDPAPKETPSSGPPAGAVRKQVNPKTGAVRYLDAKGNPL